MIELAVATGIFAVLILLFIGIYSRFVAVQERGASAQSMQEQLRLTLEVMNREIRTGYGSTYDILDNNGRGVVFRNQNGSCVAYRWQDARLERAEIDAFGDSCDPGRLSGVPYTALTSSDIVITNARFDVVRAERLDDTLANQGTVTLILEAENAASTIAPIQLQSTVASRQVIPFPGT